jgi:phenylacetate-CoA ligase
MTDSPERMALDAFHRAATRVPAYREVLRQANVDPDRITTIDAFAELPILDKASTFKRFEIEQLCIDGELGRLGTVLTSSGHSGVFAFGLTETEALAPTTQAMDDLLDYLFAVRSQRTLLINCLPMGVKVPTQACTLAETSVRSDMVVGLVHAFGKHFAQIILIGEAAFIKAVLELGRRNGIDWKRHRVHVVVGEEPLAENARKYIEHVLGLDLSKPERGLVISSMGVAEIGLNIFCEVPPVAPLIVLRRMLHEDGALRQALLGPTSAVPSIFTYDPRRVYVEFGPDGRLILTTLGSHVRLPLIRYVTGDRGAWLRVPDKLKATIVRPGLSWSALDSVPLVLIRGRGDHATAGDQPVYPESVKEGIYHDAAVVELTTANFRLNSGAERVRIRLQLSPGVMPDRKLTERFAAGIAVYVRAPFDLTCERYEEFRSGMALDYERKFQYLGT